MIIPTGVDQEPVYVTVIYGDGLQFSRGYTKSLTIHQIKAVICDIIRIQARNLKLKRIFGKGKYFSSGCHYDRGKETVTIQCEQQMFCDLSSSLWNRDTKPELLGCLCIEFNESKTIFSDSEVKMVPITGSEEKQTLAELQLKDGDQLLAEDTADKG